MWNLASDPPKGEKNKWSRDVVVVTNTGRAYEIAYYHGENDGVWQRPTSFEDHEKVDLWTELPEHSST